MPLNVDSVMLREVVYPDAQTLQPQHYIQVQFKVGMHGPFTILYPKVSFDAAQAKQDMQTFAAKLAMMGAHGAP